MYIYIYVYYDPHTCGTRRDHNFPTTPAKLRGSKVKLSGSAVWFCCKSFQVEASIDVVGYHIKVCILGHKQGHPVVKMRLARGRGDNWRCPKLVC